MEWARGAGIGQLQVAKRQEPVINTSTVPAECFHLHRLTHFPYERRREEVRREGFPAFALLPVSSRWPGQKCPSDEASSVPLRGPPSLHEVLHRQGAATTGPHHWIAARGVAEEPSAAAAAASPGSSAALLGSSYSTVSDQAQHQEIRELVWEASETQGRYSNATREVGWLQSNLAAIEAALHASVEEIATTQVEATDAHAQTAGLEDELAISHHETEGLHRCLNDLDDAVGIVGSEGPLLPDRLRSLPLQVERVLELGIRKGAALALASTQLQSGWDMHWPESGFPAGPRFWRGANPDEVVI
ncbi:uncharacterized protein LOC120644423 [Panicum virgatum]|uniref:Uncharacterized protein n=1 Tax=Panicum virgatum TaxID=38727 RepID=A0A8T0PNG4_PANVG|nr:uncharacterized protein LOC120644423 [Panicum virgatum]KAG2562119.1 hypothetical protein PVAP13_8KG124900 [Panicum virgatum]